MLEFIKKLLGGGSEAAIKKLDKTAQAVEALEDEYRKLTDEQLRGKTDEFKARLAKGETLDDLLLRHSRPSARQMTAFWECAPIMCRFWAVSCCIRAASLK